MAAALLLGARPGTRHGRRAKIYEDLGLLSCEPDLAADVAYGRIYRFENGGAPELLIGSADWMRRNLDHCVETIAPVADPALKAELTAILEVYENDNATAWDLQPDGSWIRRRPPAGAPRRASPEVFMGIAPGGTVAEANVSDEVLAFAAAS